MIWRVVILTVALPRSAAKRLRWRLTARAPPAFFTSMTRPSGTGRKSTVVPGPMPR